MGLMRKRVAPASSVAKLMVILSQCPVSFKPCKGRRVRRSNIETRNTPGVLRLTVALPRRMSASVTPKLEANQGTWKCWLSWSRRTVNSVNKSWYSPGTGTAMEAMWPSTTLIGSKSTAGSPRARFDLLSQSGGKILAFPLWNPNCPDEMAKSTSADYSVSGVLSNISRQWLENRGQTGRFLQSRQPLTPPNCGH